MIHDFRFALRQLLKSPGFAAVAILTLALGIGANTAIFSVTNAVLFRALPYKDPARIVAVNRVSSSFGLGGLSAGAFLDFREQSASFEQLAAYTETEFTLTGGGDAERIVCGEVSSALFRLLGVNPSLGRTFTPEEEKPGRDQAVVVSEAFWKRRSGGDPGFVGKTITLDDKVYTVAGIMPAGFRFPRKLEIWKPLALDPEEERHGKQFRLISLIGRLKASVSQATAEAELNAIFTRRPSEEPGAPATNARIELRPLHEQLVKDVRLALYVLLGAVAFVLLIACANVANLMLARAATRRNEIAIRAALGAGRRRIVAQLLRESVLVSLIGGAGGLLLAVWGIDLLVANLPADAASSSFYGVSDVGINRNVLLFTLGISIGTGIFFGLAPALSSARLDLNEALKATAKTASSRSGLRSAFVISQLALALVLLIGAGLMTRSFIRLINVKLGFNPKNVLTMRVELPRSRYQNGAARVQFFDQLLERARSIPGLQSAGAISQLPLSGYSMMGRFGVEGQPPPEPGKGRPMPIGVVTPAYFQAMQIPLVQGRFFDARDAEKMPEVAIVNESMVKKFWPGENPIGKKVGAGCADGLCRTVVGVVGDIRHEGLGEEAQPEIYMPHQQFPLPNLSLVLRTSGDPLAVVSAIRNEVRLLDKDQPVALVQTLEAHISESVLQPRLLTTLLSVFAGLGLILAAVGVYAMMSYSVSQRRGEIGIRIALGAMKTDILRLVVGQAILLVTISLMIGLAAAFGATRLLRSLLYEVGIWDPFTFATIVLLLSLVAIFAAWFPARRAARTDPIVALRSE